MSWVNIVFEILKMVSMHYEVDRFTLLCKPISRILICVFSDVNLIRGGHDSNLFLFVQPKGSQAPDRESLHVNLAYFTVL